MKFSIISLLICALLASSTVLAEEQSTLNTIKLDLFKESTSKWIAITVQDGRVDTTAVQMRDSADDAAWVDMQLVTGWNRWVVHSLSEYVFPLSFRITSKAEQEIVLDDIITALGEQTVDTGAQYDLPRVATRGRKSGNGRVTKAPTVRPTKAPASTKAPAGSTKAPSASTKAPAASTKAPAVTAAPTKAPSSPTTGPVASGKMGLMVPLYTYPGSTWDTVIASASKVKTVAIINPNSGPGNGPDSTYKTYMKKMQNAGVDQVGYVATGYGTRSIATVKAEIAKYASEFPEVVGIFLDEASNAQAQVSYYTQLHQYIMSMPGYKYNVLNPGTAPVQAYLSISTQIVSFESAASKFSSSGNPSFANAANKDHFSVISHTASQSQMLAGVATAKSKGYYGWIYFTDNSSAATYNTLPSYYAAMATAVATA